MTRFAQALFLTLLAALFPASTVAQNLLVNGNFDTDVSSWVKTSSTGTFVFSPLDANGSASSGSMLTTNTASTSSRVRPAARSRRWCVTQSRQATSKSWAFRL